MQFNGVAPSTTRYEAEPALAFGNAVRAFRLELSVAQEELAALAGVERWHMGLGTENCSRAQDKRHRTDGRDRAQHAAPLLSLRAGFRELSAQTFAQAKNKSFQ